MARLPPTPTTIKRLFVYSRNFCAMPDSSDMNKIANIVNEKTVLAKLEVGKSGATPQDDDWFTVEISPKTESAGNSYYCRMVKRSKNNDEVVKTLRKSHTVLEEMAKFAEKKNQS